MIRPSLRRLSALAVILVLTVLFAAPAGAGPGPVLRKEQPPAKEEPGWLDTALTFLRQLVPEKALDLTLPVLPLPPLDHTGSCIDPLGNPCIFRPL